MKGNAARQNDDAGRRRLLVVDDDASTRLMFDVRFRLVRPGRSRRGVWLRARALRRDGETVGLSGLAQDVTSLLLQELELERASRKVLLEEIRSHGHDLLALVGSLLDTRGKK